MRNMLSARRMSQLTFTHSRLQHDHPRIACGLFHTRLALQLRTVRQLHDLHRLHGISPHLRRAHATVALQSGQALRLVLQFDVSVCALISCVASRSLTPASLSSAICFEAVLFVFMFFPVAPRPDAPNFNWTSLVFVVTVIWAVAYYYVWGKKSYAGPVAYVKRQGL